MEEWRDIINYEGLYQVSTLGRVRSLDRVYQRTAKGATFMQSVKGRILRGFYNKGYHTVNLCNGGEERHAQVHRLVASAFIPNPENLPLINHKGRNPANNRVENLEWCTSQYNNTYDGANFRGKVKRRKKIEQMTLDGEHVAFFETIREVTKKLGYSYGNISACCRGEKPTMYGYKWRYSNG